jgi:hypothetical protein
MAASAVKRWALARLRPTLEGLGVDVHDDLIVWESATRLALVGVRVALPDPAPGVGAVVAVARAAVELDWGRLFAAPVKVTVGECPVTGVTLPRRGMRRLALHHVPPHQPNPRPPPQTAPPSSSPSSPRRRRTRTASPPTPRRLTERWTP